MEHRENKQANKMMCERGTDGGWGRYVWRCDAEREMSQRWLEKTGRRWTEFRSTLEAAAASLSETPPNGIGQLQPRPENVRFDPEVSLVKGAQWDQNPRTHPCAAHSATLDHDLVTD